MDRRARKVSSSVSSIPARGGHPGPNQFFFRELFVYLSTIPRFASVDIKPHAETNTSAMTPIVT
jgi:hypothetical protein